MESELEGCSTCTLSPQQLCLSTVRYQQSHAISPVRCYLSQIRISHPEKSSNNWAAPHSPSYHRRESQITYLTYGTFSGLHCSFIVLPAFTASTTSTALYCFYCSCSVLLQVRLSSLAYIRGMGGISNISAGDLRAYPVHTHSIMRTSDSDLRV